MAFSQVSAAVWHPELRTSLGKRLRTGEVPHLVRLSGAHASLHKNRSCIPPTPSGITLWDGPAAAAAEGDATPDD
jgi:hypothetical protein